MEKKWKKYTIFLFDVCVFVHWMADYYAHVLETAFSFLLHHLVLFAKTKKIVSRLLFIQTKKPIFMLCAYKSAFLGEWTLRNRFRTSNESLFWHYVYSLQHKCIFYLLIIISNAYKSAQPHSSNASVMMTICFRMPNHMHCRIEYESIVFVVSFW